MGVEQARVRAAAALLAEDCTVPFIARYRKEATGGLDEVAVAAVRDRLAQLAELDKRRASILKTIEEQGKLTDDLRTKIEAAETMSALEDLYLPYRPKRRTRATVAREKGLEPLADTILAQGDTDPAAEAAAFVDADKGVGSVDEALGGARDIIAERINEDEQARARLRKLFGARGIFHSRVVAGKEAEGAKYRDYFDWSEPAAKTPSHRALAMRRGEKEGALTLRVQPEEDEALAILDKLFVTADNAAAAQVREAIRDCYRRLLSPSMETETRLDTKRRADAEAIRIFAENLRQLLMASPLGRKRILAIDPGLRTGCKLVCMDEQGKLLCGETIYPVAPRNETEASAATIRRLCEERGIEAIAVGDGTGGRETERFVRGLGIERVIVALVNESGASVYSASRAAREEFPDHDLTVRGAVSIGRRLMDPLAELVKIDPKAIGVGQYQHDVDQAALRSSLDDVVSSCVNAVGVEVNTASRELLNYVSGLGPALARCIVAYRDEHGPFRSRGELRNVPRLGPKAFEQAAGFLRICDGENPLDASAVHPESYALAQRMAESRGCAVADLMRDPALREGMDLDQFVTDTVGLPTLADILAELAKPGRDPRKEFESVRYQEGVEKIGDLEPGMRLPGVVTNITAFGAFVDVGVHQDGLVHISELADRFVKDPTEVVKLRQPVTVTVLSVDMERKRISLSMRSAEKRPERQEARPAERTGPPAAERRKPRTDEVRRPEKPKSRPRRAQGRGPRPEAAQDPARRGSNNPFADFLRDNPLPK